MAYPLTNMTTRRVVATYADEVTGRPARGKVTFTPQAFIRSIDGTTLLVPTPFTVPLDDQGRVQIDLPVAADADYSPAIVYQVDEKFQPAGISRGTYHVSIPASGSPFNLIGASPVVPPDPMSDYLLLSGGIVTGDLEVQGTTTLNDLVVTGDVTGIDTTEAFDGSLTGDLSVTGDAAISGDLTVTGTINGGSLTSAPGDFSVGDDLTVADAALINGNLTVIGNAAIGGSLVGNLHLTGDLVVDGDYPSDGLTISQVRTALEPFNVLNFGAVMDAQRRSNATNSNTSSSTTLTVPGAGFVSGDVGKTIVVYQAFSQGTIRTISSVTSSTVVVLSGSAGCAVNGADTDMVVWGTNDAAALQAAATAAGVAAAGKNLNSGSNVATFNGHPTVVIPPINEGGMVIAGGSTVNFPSTVGLRSKGTMLYGCLTSRTMNVLTFHKGPDIDDLRLHAFYGGGIVVGDDAVDCHSTIGKIEVYYPGASCTALDIQGFHHEIDEFWVKGGGTNSIGIDGSGSSDVFVASAYMVGVAKGLVLDNTNNMKFGHLRADTITGVSNNNCLAQIDRSTNVQITAQAFTIVNSGTYTLDNLIKIGQNSTTPSHGLQISIQAQRTGGNVLQLAYCQGSKFSIQVTNTDLYNFGAPNTQSVAYGAGLSGPLFIEQWLPTTVTASTGTVVGELITHTSAGTSFSGAVNIGGTAAAVSAAPPEPDFMGPVTVVEDFQSGHTWALDGGSPGTFTANQATANASHGPQVMKIVTDASAGVSSMSVTGKAAVDLSGKTKQIGLWTYLFAGPQALSAFELRAAPAGGLTAGNYVKWDLANTAISTSQSLLQASELANLPLSMGDAAITGTPDLTAITEWQIKIAGRTSGPAPGSQTVYFGGIELMSSGLAQFGTNGIAVFTFDDSMDGQATYARPYLRQKGWTGTVFPIIDALGGTNRLTSAQLRILQRSGMEIGVHSYAQAIHDALVGSTDTQAAVVADFDQARRWMSDNSYPGTSLAYSGGVFGVTTGNATTPYSVQARRWFKIARTVSYQYPGTQLNPVPLWNKMHCRAVTVGSATAPTVAAMVAGGGLIERAASANALLIFTIHQITSGGTTGPTTLTLADFQTLINKVQSTGMTVTTLGQVASALPL